MSQNTTITFDTLEFDKALEDAGFDSKQAAALTKALAKVVSGDNVVTKSYLDLRLAELKNEIIKWVLGVSVGQAAIVISCIKLIH